MIMQYLSNKFQPGVLKLGDKEQRKLYICVANI